MRAVLPIFLQEDDTGWRHEGWAGHMESFLARVAGLFPESLVVTSLDAVRDMAGRLGLRTVRAAPPPASRLMPGAEATLAHLDGVPATEPLAWLNFRNPQAPELVRQAMDQLPPDGWSWLASAAPPEDHPCQSFSMERLLAADLVVMLDPLADSGRPGCPRLTRPFDLNWEHHSVDHQNGGRYFRPSDDPARPGDLDPVDEAQARAFLAGERRGWRMLFVREDLGMARVAVDLGECDAVRARPGERTRGRFLVGVGLPWEDAGPSMLLYNDTFKDKLTLRLNAPEGASTLRVICKSPAGAREYLGQPCLPGDNAICLDNFDSYRHFSHLAVVISGCPENELTPDFQEPFPGGGLWSRKGHGEARSLLTGKVIHGRQAFPPILEMDGSFLVHRRGTPAAWPAPDAPGLMLFRLPEAGALVVRSLVDRLRLEVRRRGLPAPDAPEPRFYRVEGAAPAPPDWATFPAAGQDDPIRALRSRAVKAHIVLDGLADARDLEGSRLGAWQRSLRRFIIGANTRYQTLVATQILPARIDMARRLLGQGQEQEAVRLIFDCLGIDPASEPARDLLGELAAGGNEAAQQRLAATRLEYLEAIPLPKDMVPKDLAAGDGFLLFAEARTDMVHRLDLVSGEVVAVGAPPGTTSYGFSLDRGLQRVARCDFEARSLVLSPLCDGATRQVSLPDILGLAPEDFTLAWVAAGDSALHVALNLQPSRAGRILTLDPATLAPLAAPWPVPEERPVSLVAACGDGLFFNAFLDNRVSSLSRRSRRGLTRMEGSEGVILRMAAGKGGLYVIYAHKGLVKYAPDGDILYRADISGLAGQMVALAGLALSPCGSRLYLADMHGNTVHTFRVEDTGP